MKLIDVCVLSYNRLEFTKLCLKELRRRTRMPYRTLVVDNGSVDGSAEYLLSVQGEGLIDKLILKAENTGVHDGWNVALENVESDIFVTMDNDIIPQNSEPDWLTQLLELLKRSPEFGGIALRAHMLIGEPGDRFKNAPEVLAHSHIPAYCRVMYTDKIREGGGWRNIKEPGRNNEDWHISKLMQNQGMKTGFARDIRCIHLWGDENSHWGYPLGEKVGHREISPPVHIYNWDRQGVDWETCRKS